MGIQTTGIAEMRQNLQRLSDEVRQKLVLRAVRDAGNVIRDAMRESAHVLAAKNPGSDSLEPGQLRADIRVRARVDEDGMARAIIGPVKYEYVARWVELGHRMVVGGYSHVNRKGTGFYGPGREVREIPAYPTLRPAFERTQSEAFDKFKGSMQTYLPEALR